ncbi:MAG: stage V sporulation protein SpoVM [Ruminococcus sp.]|nr:stage V sporulation protein SpoVM [Ruminococcus sp.]
MKVVVVDNPRFISFILRKIYKIKKQPKESD